MPRLKLDGIRRQQLIEATITSVQKHGFYDTTLSSIATEVGLSTGNIHYYFGSKNALFEAVMHKLLDMISEQTKRHLTANQSPREQLEAILRASFSPEIYHPEFCRTWLHFLAGSASDPRLREIERAHALRIRGTIRQALLHLMPPDPAVIVTQQLAAVIDGLWVRCAQGAEISTATAEATARDFLAHRLKRLASAALSD